MVRKFNGGNDAGQSPLSKTSFFGGRRNTKSPRTPSARKNRTSLIDDDDDDDDNQQQQSPYHDFSNLQASRSAQMIDPNERKLSPKNNNNHPPVLYPNLEAFPTPEPDLDTSIWNAMKDRDPSVQQKQEPSGECLGSNGKERFLPIPTGSASSKEPPGREAARKPPAIRTSDKKAPPRSPTKKSSPKSIKIPLFGSKPSKKSSLEDELPDTAIQREQHSAFEARRLQDQEQAAVAARVSPSTTATSPDSNVARIPARDPPSAGSLWQAASMSRQPLHTNRKPPPSISASTSVDTVEAIPMGDTATTAGGAQALATILRSDTTSKDSSLSRPTATATTSDPKMSETDMDDARGYARALRNLCTQDDGPEQLDLDYLQNLLALCEDMQSRVTLAIEQAFASASGGDDTQYTEDLFQLNDVIIESVRVATLTRDEFQKMPASNGGDGTPALRASFESDKQESVTDSLMPHREHGADSTDGQVSLDVSVLAEKKDVFTLICMLRAQQDERRLEAAVALMKFARNAESQTCTDEDIRVRNEIRSSGGMHSLLTLFRTRGTLYETKVVVALAVSYLLPSFVDAMSTSPAPGLGLKIMECLRMLSIARSISPNGETITAEESFKASAKGLFIFWINHLLPMLVRMGKQEEGKTDEAKVEDPGQPLVRTSSVGGRIRSGRTSSGGRTFDQRKEAMELEELLKMTVSLIIFIAQPQVPKDGATVVRGDSGLETSRCTLVEQVCAVEVARPIAVREGILKILVCWIKSMDPEKIRPAASALRHLTSIKDKYMAGWIHSQMVNEGALSEIVKLTSELDHGIGHDVQLAVAQILSSLCVAPHTRAAVVDANGIALLIQFLCEHKESPSEEGALYAGSALLQLAAGAITRASVFGEEELDLSVVPLDKSDMVVENIIESGAIESFVDIALSSPGKLRSVAIEALRVLSEDVSPTRQTRSQLCFHGAVKALGVALKDIVRVHDDRLRGNLDLLTLCRQDSTEQLHEGLCALANILDPLPDVSPETTMFHRRISTGMDTRKLLVNGCIQTTDSGGLESLLFIASLPFGSPDGTFEAQMQRLSILEEACRSLASMSPLLLTEHVASMGYSRWTDEILKALHRVSTQMNDVQGGDEIKMSISEVLVNVFRSLDALAKCEPLKVRIIDQFLAFLLEANTVRDGTDTSVAANQAFQSLGFTDDELAAQVTGNNPQLLADWFCLERSFLIQAMARDEIRSVVRDIWRAPFEEMKNSLETEAPDSVVTKLFRETSDFSTESDEGAARSADLFENFANDFETHEKRRSLLRQYREIYGRRDNIEPSPLLESVTQCLDEGLKDGCLLRHQVYPLDSSEAETDWILSHDNFIATLKDRQGEASSRQSLSPHVQRLLECVFPSRLLREAILPVCSLRPEAPFDFRGIMMPQKRYFSFRREGQLLSRLCTTESAAFDSAEIHWTIGFRNSTFAGEFAESLVQALYLCPVILGLSFCKDNRDIRHGKSDEGGALLVNLAGSLPPWITSLTFDGLLNGRDLKSMVDIIETMGKLSAGHELQMIQREVHQSARRRRDFYSSATSSQAQGRFSFFSICRSPQIVEEQGGVETWDSFFRLLGQPNISGVPPRQTPLSSLRALDLSGNQLGDDLCASVLQLVHEKNTGCCLEELDLSDNCILAGTKVLNVLRRYVDDHRYSHQAGRKKIKKGWKSPLHTLYLSRNGLHIGKAWLELVTLLKHNALELQVLDLSFNDLSLASDEIELGEVVVSSILKNTCLQRLNLSNNKFSPAAVDYILDGLSTATNESGLSFLQLDENQPPLSVGQLSELESFCRRSRRTLLRHSIAEREKRRLEDIAEDEKGQHADIHELPRIDEDLKSPPDNYKTDGVTEDTKSPYPDLPTDSREMTIGDNMITVLFSAPLVYHDERRILRPFAKLDLRMERELMWQCLKEASRDIELLFDNATSDRLLAAISKRCTCLHYSGHGHQEFLPFENRGGPQWLNIQDIARLISNSGRASFRFVFVSACHSYNVGMTFASAGVPHVVCCRQESEVKDSAALSFTRNFYLALAVGNTVKEAFDQGCRAVRATPNLRDAEAEMDKFRLLPEDGNHDVKIFNAKVVPEWPVMHGERLSAKSRRASRVIHKKGASELNVRNIMQEDPSPSPPQFFLGREVEMYEVLQKILETRLVSVVGEAGIGRSSLLCALCHYINERASTILEIERIYHVKAKRDGKKNGSCALIRRLIQKLGDADMLRETPSRDADIEDLSEVVCRALKNQKALIVFDRVDLLEDSDETNEFPMVLRKLIHETRNVRILLSNRRALGIPSIGEKSIELGPLAFGNTVRLFANLCPFLHTRGDRRRLFRALVTDTEQEHLLPTDPGLSEATSKIFYIIGSGVPSQVEKAAYNMTKKDFLGLMNGSILDTIVVPMEVQVVGNSGGKAAES